MQKPTQNFRIDRISIRNYKGIDSLDLEFPRPKFPNDPDIFVIGSRNGLGKTSVLECCALGLSFLHLPRDESVRHIFERCGGPLLRISSESGDTTLSLSSFSSEEKDEIIFSYDTARVGWGKGKTGGGTLYDHSHTDKPAFFRNYFSQSSNPAVDDNFLYFPDHRFISKSPISLKNLAEVGQDHIAQTFPQKSEFKKRVLEIILRKSGLIEGQDNKRSEKELRLLNDLVKYFAKCRLSDQFQLHEFDNDVILDVRVRSLKSEIKDTYSFDGLSSGQKEVITALFLIWYCTRNAPKVVLIDEPEQHLNAEWHRLFVHKLWKIAPWNQYILATHSKHIASAVDVDRQIMLTESKVKPS